MEIIYTLDRIFEVAEQLAAFLENYRVVALSGSMGAGKTTLVHALCRQLGVTETVSSPTFALIQEYRGSRYPVIYHIDLYRINSAAEALDAGMEDCLLSGHLCFVEWPERAPGLLPDDTLHVILDIQSPVERKLTVELPQ